MREDGRDNGAITFDLVQERLVEAWGFLRRMPDREGAWLKDVRASAVYGRGQLSRQELWALYKVDSDDYDREQRPKLPGLRSVEVDRMEEALGWVGHVDARDRKLLGVVLAQLQGERSRPSWTGAARAIGWGGHPDALAKRYSRAVTAICVKLSRGESGGNARV